ncbi:MAG: hypothetical protein F4Y52_00065 [Synechococcus sp. SB0664_bin_36]|nr:hypothetical protein [Synechococcus sp. SB0664_bin_36]
MDLAWSSVRPDLLRQPICHQLLRHWLLSLQPELAPRQRSRAYSLGVTITDDATMAALNQTWGGGGGEAGAGGGPRGADG